MASFSSSFTGCAALALYGVSLTFAAADDADDDAELKKNALNSLKIHEGTTLKRIKIPRYNADFTPHSLVQAEFVRAASRQHLELDNLQLQLFDKQGDEQFLIKLNQASYFQDRSIISSQKGLTAISPIFNTQAQGLLLHLESKRAFLFGPGHTTFKKNTQTATTMRAHSFSSPLLAGAFVTFLPISQEGLNTANLSQQKEAELQYILQQPSRQHQLNKQLKKDEEQALVSKDLEDSEALHFLQQYAPEKQESMLIQVKKDEVKKGKQEKNAPNPQPNQAQPKEQLAEQPNNLEIPKKNQAKPKNTNPSGLRITFEGGAFFDSEKNIASYLKNVTVNEPKLKLRCSKELRILFKDITTTVKGKKKTKKEVKTLLAIGNVHLNGAVTNKGKRRIILARAAIVEYDYKSQKTILKGGKPSIEIIEANGGRFKQTTNNDKQWIVIEKNGSFRIKGGGKQLIEGIDSLRR